MDRLEIMLQQQERFMKLLVEKRGFPEFPLNLTDKSSQKFIKSIAYDAMGELHEAVQELKNAKAHRATEINEFDRASYVEELVDVQHFLNEILLLSGITTEEFFQAYLEKGETNVERINKGY